jgi:hypothetical protein
MAHQAPPPDIIEGLTVYRQSCRRANDIHRDLLLSPPWSTYHPHCHLCAPSQYAFVWNSACFESNGRVPQYASTLNDILAYVNGTLVVTKQHILVLLKPKLTSRSF